jgi:hypothetical protein
MDMGVTKEWKPSLKECWSGGGVHPAKIKRGRGSDYYYFGAPKTETRSCETHRVMGLLFYGVKLECLFEQSFEVFVVSPKTSYQLQAVILETYFNAS